MDANLARRIAFAAVAIPLALGLVWLGGPFFVAVVALISILGARELYGLATLQGVSPSLTFGLPAAAAFAPAAWVTVTGSLAGTVVARVWPYAAALWLMGLFTWVLWRHAPTAKPMGAAAVTVLGAIYCGGLPAFIVQIRHANQGPGSWLGTWLVFFPLVITWIGDTAAMFGGRMIGGPKLAPVVSPGKTRAGAVAGLLGSLVAAVIFALVALRPFGVTLAPLQLVAFAVVLSVVGQVGDLVESLFKREVGLKDSSHLIPGHGGILDRFDSLYFVLPVAAAMYRWFGVI
ncbi:MAG TPA: phosphatidate cytidylyltransferase [Gemmatimonadales bacterium]|jgi:phosphatidate cytidylyltransferase|nr:phosphatidate cytidylyltransferase [Gemmatimonadales bacterium]